MNDKGCVILLGATGQLGHSIQLELAQRNNPYYLLSYTHKQLDCTDPYALQQAIEQWIDNSKKHIWTVIVNCVAYTHVDRAEDPDEQSDLLDLNTFLPARLAESNLPIIHISTDYVFDGQKGTPYYEQDTTNPQSLYGRTKRQGELALLMHPTHPSQQHLVIRTQWLWAPWGKNFVRTILCLAHQDKPLRVVNDQIGSPTSAPSLAHAICHILSYYERDGAFRTSLLHYANRGSCSWYDLAYKAIDLYCPDYNLSQIIPIATADYPTPAHRPPYSVLATDRLTTYYDIIPPTWQEELIRTKLCIQR